MGANLGLFICVHSFFFITKDYKKPSTYSNQGNKKVSGLGLALDSLNAS